MSTRTIPARKLAYQKRLIGLFQKYKSVLVFNANNVGSNQLQTVRIVLRGRAEIIMGKNTMIRRILRDYISEDPKVENFLRCVAGNVGFAFTDEDIVDIRTVIESQTRPAAAKVGVIAPNDVVVPAGPTGLDPGQTSFFQAMNVATKIVKGQIEIVNKVNLITKGNKVGSSECSLLAKLNICPFSYAPSVVFIYDEGSVYTPEILDLNDDDLLSKFFNGVRKVASISMAVGYPTLAAVPHYIAGAFQKMLALAVTTDYEFEEAKPYKEYLANPEAYLAAHGGGAAATADAKEDDKEEEKEVEEEEESSGGGGMGLFGDDSDSDSD